jgi:aspartate aminotransferase-like enzyme
MLKPALISWKNAPSAMQGEGLDRMWSRHAEMHEMLWDGLKAFGLQPLVKIPEDRLVTINTIKVRYNFCSPVHTRCARVSNMYMVRFA